MEGDLVRFESSIKAFWTLFFCSVLVECNRTIFPLHHHRHHHNYYLFALKFARLQWNEWKSRRRRRFESPQSNNLITSSVTFRVLLLILFGYYELSTFEPVGSAAGSHCLLEVNTFFYTRHTLQNFSFSLDKQAWLEIIHQ